MPFRGVNKLSAAHAVHFHVFFSVVFHLFEHTCLDIYPYHIGHTILVNSHVKVFYYCSKL